MRNEEFLQKTLGAMDLVHNLARRVVHDEATAEEIVQETYLRAYDSWLKHRWPDRVEPWMATICLNVARSELRRRRRRVIEVPDAAAGHDVSAEIEVEKEAIANLDVGAVRRALWQLPEEQRIAVTLMDLCDLTAAEAAKAMKCPRGTVLSRVHRGRKALAILVRKEVEQHES
ncbi:MAG: RNA polymerase sigma factor [Actinomycetota bacterium]